MTADGGPAPPAPEHASRLAWTSYPLRDDYPRSLLLIAFILAFVLGATIVLEGVAWGLVSLAVLLGATRTYFVRTRYELDDEGIAARRPWGEQRRRWSEVKNAYAHRDGIFLTPFAEPSRLDPFRGIYLRYSGNKAEVDAFVRSRVGGDPAAQRS